MFEECNAARHRRRREGRAADSSIRVNRHAVLVEVGPFVAAGRNQINELNPDVLAWTEDREERELLERLFGTAKRSR